MKYHKLFLIRFITYFTLVTGIVAIFGEFGPVAWEEFLYRKDQLFGVKYTLPPLVQTSANINQASSSGDLNSSPSPASLGFGDLPETSEDFIKPVSTDYGIVIEKINANAKVIPDVNPGDSKQYTEALSKGVAAASGSTEPGQPGNLFMFSHSTDAPWNIVRYNAIFYLLREMEPGDKISLFYKNRRYDYIVYDKTIAKANDVSFLNDRYDKPVLTLQTCDPPGTTLNRLIVRARLIAS